ncbi:MAG: hypothetical protein R3Y11_11320, partial [Pseudomonadota bacterium]
TPIPFSKTFYWWMKVRSPYGHLWPHGELFYWWGSWSWGSSLGRMGKMTHGSVASIAHVDGLGGRSC